MVHWYIEHKGLCLEGLVKFLRTTSKASVSSSLCKWSSSLTSFLSSAIAPRRTCSPSVNSVAQTVLRSFSCLVSLEASASNWPLHLEPSALTSSLHRFRLDCSEMMSLEIFPMALFISR
ncbi:hypothetical protein IscW_ISCW004112 [Ixodes scapularis]|uniref:Uncharacterized protein n=1 Tax=Ixodes scapularis TaxID=6945 RepID=B7PHM5_IXOSC|nr:hypothetical protein IscW_ISCW004112 [Ixodes scapularis]|eukprot:XP_002403265.1 hypothetical protein IscW_ISCW004112 [Ixodes scapularis]